MGSFEITNIKLGKANAVTKHRRFRKMASVFRIVEICVILVLVSRFTSQLPIAVNFKDVARFLVSARFVFILGNVIVAILFAKSGQFSSQDAAKKDSGNDFYSEFVQKIEKTAKSKQFSAQDSVKKDSGSDMHMKFAHKSQETKNINRFEVEYREKPSICTEKLLSNEAYTSSKTKSYKRSQSENFKRLNCERPCRELRRAETEKFKKSTESAERLVESAFPEDEMSNEEFRRTIEAFIARQQKFRIEEEYSVI